MSTIPVDVSPETYERLQDQARQVGKSPGVLIREFLEEALDSEMQVQPRTAREVLEAAGRARPLSETLRRKIIPGVTLEEVRQSLTQADGSSLSDIVLEQRGPKS